jgi:propanol-preferring alcohol dehydrogenase
MHAMVLEQPRQPLRAADLPLPRPGPEQVLLPGHAGQ